MGICYEENEPRGNGPHTKMDSADASRFYLTHARNWFYLRFIMLRSDDWAEKRQAQRELTICDRKLAFWRRHPNFNRTIVEQGLSELKRAWNSTETP